MKKSLLKTVVGREGFEIRIHCLGERYIVWLGPLTVRQQREYALHVQSIVDSFKVGTSQEPESLKWFETIPQRIRDRFVAWGMLPAAQTRGITMAQRTVAGWTQLFIDEIDGKARTKNNYHQARTWLLKSIDGKRDIGSVTPGELKRWQGGMKSKLALTSRNSHLKRVKAMFRGAVEDRLIPNNPAIDLKEEKSTKRIDRSRQFFINAATTAMVLRKLPDTNWRLLFCLMRFQGLRRHEVFALDWSNIDWETNELTVPDDTKTGTRTMPIFTETLPHLRDAFEIAEPGDKVVRWKGSQDSLTMRLKRQVTNILGSCWPKACQQLRSTRRTELDAKFAGYVVNEWLGHDSDTAELHYQQVTPEHLLQAASMVTIAPECEIRTEPCTEEPHSTEAHSGQGVPQKAQENQVFVGCASDIITPGRDRTCD